MELLKQKIMEQGRVIDGKILKVDSFLNHQIDVELFNEMGKELKRRYEGENITKILTLEVSGIAIAVIAAQHFKVPVVYAKKYAGTNMDKDAYESNVYSYTKNSIYSIRVSKKYIDKEDKVLLIDDFLANGSALQGLVDLTEQAGAKVVGAGIAIEKRFQGGRSIVEQRGVRIESLAVINSMENNELSFA